IREAGQAGGLEAVDPDAHGMGGKAKLLGDARDVFAPGREPDGAGARDPASPSRPAAWKRWIQTRTAWAVRRSCSAMRVTSSPRLARQMMRARSTCRAGAVRGWASRP